MRNGEKELESFLDNMSNEEIEELLKECGFKIEKVKNGCGGLFIDGKRITADDFKNNSLFELNRKA